MANNTVTRAAALAYVLENCPVPADIEATLRKMYAQVTKASTAPKSPTKDQLTNLALASRVYDWMQEQEVELFTTVDLRDAFTPEVLTTQKASAIFAVLLKEGKVEKALVKGRVFYKLIVNEG